jgi:acetyl esterase/lipase
MTLTRGHAYDPELAPIAAAVPPLDLVDYAKTRSVVRPLPDDLPSEIRWTETRATAGEAVDVRVYQPPVAGPKPAIVHFHAGGYVTGSLHSSHAHCVRLSAQLGAVVVSVGYRLAPEHPFPSAFEDGMTALAWLYEQADAFGVDVTRVALHGRSAGGGLAARVAVAARDRGLGVCFQYLNCPQLDPIADGPSMVTFHDTAFVTAETIQTGWRHYLGPEDEWSPALLAAASPAHVAELNGVAPAYVAVAEFDPLRDEGIAYARRLSAAGVPVELHVFPGTFHCSAVVARTAAVSQRELAEETTVLGRALREPGEAR